jgi:predicted Co/Zn/Cd cation transporter (cation efflux family)
MAANGHAARYPAARRDRLRTTPEPVGLRHNGAVSLATDEQPRAADVRTEQRLLRLSTVSAGLFAAMAISWGWWAASQVIVLDGVYALIGVLLGGLSLRAAVLVERGPTVRYPFGREALAPLVVGVQGLVLLGSLGYAVLDATEVILTGGSQTAFGSALGYSVASAMIGFVLWRAMRRNRSSELVAAEAAAWLAGMLLSLGMFVGFLAAVALDGTAAAGIVPYIDPGMVIIAALAIAPTPVRMLRQTARELLEGAPPAQVADPITATVRDLSRERGLPEPIIRIGKLGRKIYLEVHYVVAEDGTWSIAEADQVRRVLLHRLQEPGRTFWITVELHTDPDWDRASVQP